MGRFCLLPGKRVPGWCEGMWEIVDGRPGADFLNVSRGVRVSPLQLLSARKGIQVVPRKIVYFRPESL